MNKVDELECVLLQHDPHIIAITETWLHEDIADVFLVAYNVLRTYRQGAEGRWRFTEVLPSIPMNAYGASYFLSLCVGDQSNL